MSSATRDALQHVGRPLALRGRTGWMLLAAGGSLLVLGVVAWLLRAELARAPLWVPLAWLGVIALLGAGLAIISRDGATFTPVALARRLESSGAWRPGALRGLLEPPVRGASDQLRAHADRAGADAVARDANAAVAPLAARIRRRVLRGAGAVVAGLLLLGSARPWNGAPSRLWHPARAVIEAAQPVRITAVRSAVDRGARAELRVEAPGRARAVLFTRAPGDTWSAHTLALDADGRAAWTSPPLTADLFAHARASGRGSDTVEVTVRLPAFLGALTVTAHYPRYLGLEDEPLPVSGDTVLLPAGTRVVTAGEATTPLGSARWIMGAATDTLETRGSSFRGTFTPVQSGDYRLEVLSSAGASIGGEAVHLPIRLLADSAPEVRVPVPGADTVAPLSLRLPLVIDAHDDHAVSSVTVEMRKGRDSFRSDSVPLGGGGSDRVILSYDLDLVALGAQPGDTVRYRILARDNAPAAHVGRSPEYLVRVPSAEELRAAQRMATAAAASSLDSLVQRTEQVSRQTEDLSRERARASAGREGTDPPLSFEQAKRAEAAADATSELVRQAEELKGQLDALRQAAVQAGLDDPAFQKQLADVAQELARALTPELRAKLAELQKALQQLDAEQAQRALQNLSEAQNQLKNALERSRELFRRAAEEGELASLSAEARDLAKAQNDWNAKAASADSARAAADQQQLAQRADSLSAQLKAAAGRMDSSAAQQALQQAARQAGQAGQEMQQAGQQMRAGNRGGAQQHGRNAENMLTPLAPQMDQARKSIQDDWREEVMRALDQSLAETSRLARQELALSRQLDAGAPADAARKEQAGIEDGLEKVAERIRDVSGKNALVSQQIGIALEAARQQMASAREALASATPNLPAGADRTGTAVDALNTAAYMMVRSRNDVAGSASGSGLAEAMERMSQLAGQQGQVGQQLSALIPMMGQGQAGMQQQLSQLAAAQRAIAEQLERMQAQGNMPGAGELAQDAKDQARRIEAGRLDRQTTERQEQLFRRMLDAGRTLQGREPDENKERQSTTARDGNVHLPPALREQLERAGAAARLPGWEELQRLSPEDRRLVVDYFRRLAEEPAR